jgi:hypothetical protein
VATGGLTSTRWGAVGGRTTPPYGRTVTLFAWSVLRGGKPPLAEYRANHPEANWFDLSEHGFLPPGAGG